MKNKFNYPIRENIRKLNPYSCARNDYASGKGIFLDANENPYGNYNRYPDPLQFQLKQKISEIKNCNADQIFLGNGSDEIIDLAFRIFCEPYRDKALSFTPAYGMYEVAAGINAVSFVKVPLDRQFQIDLKTLTPLLSDQHLKLIFICSPNNPTGNTLHLKDIEFILNRFSGMVLIDEAYIDFAQQESMLERLTDYPNLIILQTLSKAWGLAGLRLGIAYMNEEVVQWFNKVKPPYNVSTINKEKAMEVLEQPSVFKQNLKGILTERNRMQHELNQLSIIKYLYPSDANFFLAEVEDAGALYRYLLQEGIIVRNRNTMVPNCLRITIGTQEENEKLIRILKEAQHG